MEEILCEILEFLDGDMNQPKPYGWFHLLWLGLSFGFGVLLCRIFPKGTEQQVRTVIFGVALLVTMLEIYKQVNYSFSYKGGNITGDYQWYIFPWQFCSTPMYVGLLAGVTKGKLHRSLCAYLATFALFAGLCVMFYPTTVFVDTIGINIQTMVCHGSMISVAMYLLYTGYVKAEGKTVLRALPVFIGAVTLAVVMNEIAYRTGLLERETFNMFFVSPHCEPSLPVYSLVQQYVAFPWCLTLYVAGFTAAAYIMILLAKLALKLKKTKAKECMV